MGRLGYQPRGYCECSFESSSGWEGTSSEPGEPGIRGTEECVRVGGGVVREPGFRNVGGWNGSQGVLWSPGSALFGPVGGKGLHQGKGGFSKGVGPGFHLRSPRRSSEPGRDRTFLSFLARKPGNQISKSASFQAQPVLSNRQTLAPELPGKAQLCQGSHPQAPEESAASKCTAVLFLFLAMDQIHLLSIGPIQ